MTNLPKIIMKTPMTGYYSVIQFTPDRSRSESANVGVLLFVPEARYLATRTTNTNDRIRRFFGEDAPGIKVLNTLKRAVENRLRVESPRLQDRATLAHFLRLFANEISFTDLRAVRVVNPDLELAQLFHELVGGRTEREVVPPSEGLERVRRRLEMPDVAQKMERDIEVKIPILGETLPVDYAFQNGRFNLIQLREFRQSREIHLLKDASLAAVSGHYLYRHADPVRGDRQLILVASLGEEAMDHQDQLQQLFNDQHVLFFTDAEEEKLVHLIETAH